MEKVHSLHAGTGRAQVDIALCLPLDGFTISRAAVPGTAAPIKMLHLMGE